MQKIVYKYRSNNGRKINVYRFTCFYRGRGKRANKSRNRSTKINYIFIDIPKNKCYNEKAK